MKIALVDDERIYLDEMQKLCLEFAAQHTIQPEIFRFSSSEDFLKSWQPGFYSIIFLDIFMKNGNGIETAQKLREGNDNSLLVFLTSSSDFMPDAFSCHAFDYILKPITRSRVFQVLLDAHKLLPGNSRYIEVNSNRQNIPVFLSDIQSAATDAHYLDIHLKDGSLVRTRMTASEFLKLTGEDCRFLVINKGLILNMDYIFNMENNSCIMTDGSRFPLRIRKAKELALTFRQYQFSQLRQEQKNKGWNT